MSRRATAGVLAALALTAFLALTATTASAAAPAQFVGTQSWEDPTASQWRSLGGAKAQIFRAQINWAAVENERPTDCTSSTCATHKYNWDRYDKMFDQAARRGVRMLPVLLGSPSWATPDQRWVPVRYRPGYTDWKRQAFYDFAKAAAERYGTKGTFWEGKEYATSAVRARFWQIWNEPNLPNYWWNEKQSGSRMAKEYADLLKATSRALKAGNSAALIVTAGVPWSGGATIQPPEFLQKVFARSGASESANFVGLHPYARTPSLVTEAVRVARSALNRTSARNRPIWLTEMGWSSDGPRSTFRVSERYQAKYLRDTYRWLIRNRRTYGIRGGIWFNLIDVRPPSGKRDAWYYHTGLIRRDGVTGKASWRALKCVTKGGTSDCRYGR